MRQLTDNCGALAPSLELVGIVAAECERERIYGTALLVDGTLHDGVPLVFDPDMREGFIAYYDAALFREAMSRIGERHKTLNILPGKPNR